MSSDRPERIQAELAEVEARLAELRGLADRIERLELSALGPGDRALLTELVDAEIAEREEAESKEASAGWGGASTSEREPPRGRFGFFARWMARR